VSVRILHVATRHRVGGAERNLLYTVSRQLERNFEVHVAVGTEDLEVDFPPRTRIHPIPDLVRAVSPSADWRAMRAVRAMVKTHRFHVVHTHQSKAGAVGREAARGRAPIILHTVHMASFGPGYRRAQSATFLTLERRLARCTDKVVFVGEELRRRYVVARVVPPERSTIVRSPITNLASLIGLREASDCQKERTRAALGVPAGRQVVLMVGALDRRKRHPLVLRALAPLLLQGRTQVLIVGQGPERGAIEAVCRDLRLTDSARFLGFVRDVTPLYAAANVLVQASTLEGVSQAVVQAVAAGVPVIASDVDGLREVAPGSPHVTILPPDGRGLLESVSATLGAGDFSPAPLERVTSWLPDRVDGDLDRLDDWIEQRIGSRRSRRSASWRAPVSSPSAISSEELAIK
jgi:glycosyltransferase involved in cell wall biosynthesis